MTSVLKNKMTRLTMGMIHRPVISAVLVMSLYFPAMSNAQLEDPMRPPAYQQLPASVTASSENLWALSSILISPDRRVAVINGQTVHVGDRLGESVVTRIEPSSVKLKSKGREITVSLLPKIVKIPSEHGAK